MIRKAPLLPALLAVLFLAACSGVTVEGPGEPTSPREKRKTDFGKLFGEDAFSFGGPAEKEAMTSPIGVNSFLWRASLDTISFMPLVSADPFGGVIITDWHAPPETTNERFKVTLYILGRDLRADGVRAAVFRQTRDGAAGWVDASVAANTARDLENAILTRARELRIAGLQ